MREVTYGTVDSQGLIDVGGHEVVISVAGARNQGGIRLGRLAQQAVDGIGVGDPLR